MKINKHTRTFLPQLLLISGSGRNCGKTSLACEIIKNISTRCQVIGLKISPHFHKLSDKQTLLLESNGFRIYQENDPQTEKDSARMLNAGASKVYYLQCEDKNLSSVWEQFSRILPENIPVVCESGSLALIFKAGIHLLVEGKNPDKMKRSYMNNKALADMAIQFDGLNFSVDIENIHFSENKWELKEKQDDQIRRSA